MKRQDLYVIQFDIYKARQIRTDTETAYMIAKALAMAHGRPVFLHCLDTGTFDSFDTDGSRD